MTQGSRDNKCEACGADLIWALSEKRRRCPIAREPSAEGNVLVFRSHPGGETRCTTLPPVLAGLIRDRGVPLRLNHFANCADADRFRGDAA